MDTKLIKNSDINHRVSYYRQVYKQYGCISFEMMGSEYNALSEITKSYRAARKQPDFDYKAWVQEAEKNGLFVDNKATFVFGFLIPEWKSSTHITAKQEGNYIIIEVVDKEKGD